MNNVFKFHIQGMRCKSCELLTEEELRKFPYIKKVKSSSHSNTVEIFGDFGDRTPTEIAEELNEVLKTHHFTLSADKIERKINWKEFYYAIPISFTFLFFYFLLQKVGLVNLVNTDHISYGTIFVIGIIASLSSCMAIVGGLLLSVSAVFAKKRNGFFSHFLFHFGRILSFFILGGVIGKVGSYFELSFLGSFILEGMVVFAMLVLGINLLEVFPWIKKIQPKAPKIFSKHIFNISKSSSALAPFLVGIITFFLPCGFTQSMQIYALSTGNFIEGALTMLVFALGTLPVLGIISFGSFSIGNSPRAGIFFKTAGLITIFFAIFNLINILVAINILPPLF